MIYFRDPLLWESSLLFFLWLDLDFVSRSSVVHTCFFLSTGALVKVKLKLTTLPRLKYVSCVNSAVRTAVLQNYRLALHVWALTRDAQEVLPAQDGFVWNHGTYHFHTLTTDHGDVPPLEGWARMWTHPSDNEVRCGSSRYTCSLS